MKKHVILVAALFFSLTTLTFAQADINLKGVGGRLGFIMPTEGQIDNTLGFGFQANLGSITPKILLDAYVDYWAKGYDVTYYKWTWSTFGIAAIAKYKIEMEGNIHPYAGGGLGLIISKGSGKYTGPQSSLFGQYIDNADVSNSSTDVAIHLVGGASMTLSPKMDGFAEVKYTLGGIDNFGIFVGVNYKLK